MTFSEIPAISIFNHTIVVARGDHYESLTIDGKIPDTLDLIELITENYETIYVTDINGLTKGSPQIKLLKSLTDFCEVWYDAGVTNSENVYDLFISGASEVVMSSKTLKDIYELAKAHELSENLVFELDYSNGIVSPNAQLRNMSPLKLCDELLDMGINRLIFADLDRIGTNKPLEQNNILRLVEMELEIYVGGGIKLSDSPLLEKLGANGAIVELTDILSHGQVDF